MNGAVYHLIFQLTTKSLNHEWLSYCIPSYASTSLLRTASMILERRQNLESASQLSPEVASARYESLHLRKLPTE